MSLHPTDIRPSPEQQRARELFLKQEGLRIDAYAGAGKTTTLRLLASSTNGRGLYLAFNRSIAEHARGKFPTQVACATSHSLAFRAIARSFGYPEWKLTGALTLNAVVEAFRMPENLTFHSGLTLSKWSYCSVLIDAVKCRTGPTLKCDPNYFREVGFSATSGYIQPRKRRTWRKPRLRERVRPG